MLRGKEPIELDSELIQLLELLSRKFEIIMINTYDKTIMGKVNNMNGKVDISAKKKKRCKL